MKGDVVITGIGMRTSVGNDAVQTAALVRAGIDRFARWRSYGAAGAVVPPVGNGPWTEKWYSLVETPVREALWQAGLYHPSDPAIAARLGIYLVVPHPGRPGVSPDERAALLVGLDQEWRGDQVPAPLTVVAADHAGGLIALSAAQRDLQARSIDFALVLSADSLLDPKYLTSLEQAHRLKTEHIGEGLIPAEAAAVVVLERADSVRGRKARGLATLGSIVSEREPTPLGPEHPIAAEALSRAMQEVLAGEDPTRMHRVIVDLSGERWRFLEWSLAEARCLATIPAAWRLWHPADCLGDVGAATGLLHVGLAVRAFARGYAGPGDVLIVNSSPQGERVVAVVRATKEGC